MIARVHAQGRENVRVAKLEANLEKGYLDLRIDCWLVLSDVSYLTKLE